MGTAGMFIQIFAFIGSILGAIAGFVSLGDYRAGTSGIAVIAVSIAGGLFAYAVGGAFVALEEIQQSTLRSALANERAAHAAEVLAGLNEPAASKPLSDAEALIADIETNPSQSKSRGTVLRRLDEQAKQRKPDVNSGGSSIK